MSSNMNENRRVSQMMYPESIDKVNMSNYSIEDRALQHGLNEAASASAILAIWDPPGFSTLDDGSPSTGWTRRNVTLHAADPFGIFLEGALSAGAEVLCARAVRHWITTVLQFMNLDVNDLTQRETMYQPLATQYLTVDRIRKLDHLGAKL